ncbi:hypothetical protein [Mucilaginibacter glaciei]|uniref:Uncharacterized protein n=1 Tax=Mucilaginibacter glaciei TaxID=2772109 RepID=A0A926NNJ0_9SPHI|nr:hypothetical protein [Mucilaginibacter glaciei]MBD1391745.1 hypothetical protein [Mucilaginibacter glaciei]
MRYAEWNSLSNDQRKNAHWRHHPRVRLATIFSILFALVFVVFMSRIFQNRRLHVNRKPIDKEAFAIAKAFVKEKVNQPESATFSKDDFQGNVDTAHNLYQISSYVNAQDSRGKFSKSQWQAKLAYTGGDWADKNSWKVLEMVIDNKRVN